MSPNDLNTAICSAIGVDATSAIRIEIVLAPDQYPTVVVTKENSSFDLEIMPRMRLVADEE